MNRNRLNPYTATPSAPKSHRARVRFLTTPELLTFKIKCHHAHCREVGPWPRNGSQHFGGSPHASAWVAGLVPVARRDTTGAGSQKESFGHVHARVSGRRTQQHAHLVVYRKPPKGRPGPGIGPGVGVGNNTDDITK